MTTLKTQIEISADASGVETGANKAKRSLKDLGVTAQSVGKRGSEGINTIGDGGKQAAQKVDSATKNMIASIQRQIAVTEAGSRSGAEYYRVLASQRGVDSGALKPFLDQLDAVTAKQKTAQQALAGASPVLDRVGLSAKQTAAALRGVPAQFTDIATSLQAGQSPLTVFLQQGGQLKDMFGGAGPAAKALGGYVAGLVNPFTVAAAGAVALGVAVARIESSDRVFNNIVTGLRATGRESIIAREEIKALTRQMADMPGMSKSDSESAVAEFARTNQIGSEMFRGLSLAVADFAKATGQDAPAAAKQLAKAFADPAAGVKALDAAFGTLSASTIIAIEDAVKHNDILGAQRLLLDALKQSTQGLANEAMTPLQSATEKFGNAWDNAKRSLEASDGLRTVNNGVVKLIDSLTWIVNNSGKVGSALEAALPPALRRSLGALGSLANSDGSKREASGKIIFPGEAPEPKGDETALNTQVKGALALGDAYRSANSRLAEMRTTADVLSGAMAKLQAAGKGNTAEYGKLKDRLAGVNEAIANAGKSGAGAAAKTAKSLLGYDIDQIKNASESLLNAYSNSEKVLEARRSAGLVADREYYDAKRKFLQDNAQAQIAALTAENERLGRESGTADERINNEKRVADNLAKIAILKANAAANLNVLSTQETSAANRLKLAFMTARQSAQDYFDTIASQQARDLASMGMGNHQRNFNSGVNQIEDRYAGQRRDLENQRALLESQRDAQGNSMFDDAAKKQHENRLAIIDEFQGKSIASFTDYYAKLAEKQGNWSLGASEALKNYYDESRNTFQGAQQIATNALKGMEDALTTFVTTGKSSFKDLASSIVADINRVIIKQQISNALGLGGNGGGGVLGPIGAAVGALGGGTSTTAAIASAAPGDALDNFLALNKNFGGRAIGGPVSAGGMYEVNEKGRPELLQVAGKQYLMMGSQGGKVDANPQIGQRPIQVTIQQSFAAGTDRRTTDQAAAQAGYAVRRGMARNA